MKPIITILAIVLFSCSASKKTTKNEPIEWHGNDCHWVLAMQVDSFFKLHANDKLDTTIWGGDHWNEMSPLVISHKGSDSSQQWIYIDSLTMADVCYPLWVVVGGENQDTVYLDSTRKKVALISKDKQTVIPYEVLKRYKFQIW
jgi:hypothetical protein